MQVKGVGNNQIGNSYQNPNRMPNSTTGKKEDDEVSKRLEALGVKVELSFQQTGAQAQEQEPVKEAADVEKSQEAFPVLSWIKKIWDAGVAWLKSIWNDEAGQEKLQREETLTAAEMLSADATPGELGDTYSKGMEEFTVKPELVDETPLDEDADYAAVYAREQDTLHESSMSEQMHAQAGQFDYSVSTDDQVDLTTDKYRTTGTALHTSGMQDSYNRYGQHSKLGVEPSGNMQMRK